MEKNAFSFNKENARAEAAILAAILIFFQNQRTLYTIISSSFGYHTRLELSVCDE